MLRLSVVLLLLGCVACGERASNASSPPSSTFISIEGPKEGWAESIQYRSDPDGVAHLVLDGVHFELRDPAAFRLDWEVLGMAGIKVTSSFNYESNVPVEGALLAVSGREVEIVDGALMWGTENVGAVDEGDRVIVDKDGLQLE